MKYLLQPKSRKFFAKVHFQLKYLIKSPGKYIHLCNEQTELGNSYSVCEVNNHN